MMTTMMKAAVLALALACPTAALAQGLLELKDKWHECLVDEAVRLDDGISPASDIAAALTGKRPDQPATKDIVTPNS